MKTILAYLDREVKENEITEELQLLNKDDYGLYGALNNAWCVTTTQ